MRPCGGPDSLRRLGSIVFSQSLLAACYNLELLSYNVNALTYALLSCLLFEVLILEADIDKVKQELADNFAESMFDTIAPALKQAACDTSTRACTISEQVIWDVKLITTFSWLGSMSAFIGKLGEKYREELENAWDYFIEVIVKQILFGLFIMLPTLCIEQLLTIPARLRREHED